MVEDRLKTERREKVICIYISWQLRAAAQFVSHSKSTKRFVCASKKIYIQKYIYIYIYKAKVRSEG